MTEHHDHQQDHDPIDPLVDQLRRYANAAASHVSAETSVRTRPRRDRRPFLAAAAALVLLAGGVGAYRLVTTGDDVDPVRSDGPARLPLEACAGHGRDGPVLAEMHQALPFPATSTGEELARSGDAEPSFTRSFRMASAADGTGEFEVGVTTDGQGAQAGVFQERTSARPVTVVMCDPFAPEEGPPVEMDGLITRFAQSATLAVGLDRGWTLAITSSLDLSDAQLQEIASGTYWSTPTADATTTTTETTPLPVDPVLLPADPPCDDATLAEINSMRVTHLPEGFAAAGPAALSQDGRLDTETSGAWTQDFVDPSGRSIRVVNFWSDDPPAYAVAAHDGAPTQQFTLDRCGETTDVGASTSETDGRIVVSGQDWGHGGFVVHGGPGVTRDEVLAVASGLR